MIFYFSGTGNSEWVAKEVAKAQNETICFIPEVMQKKEFYYRVSEKEKIGFVFPIYSWGPPKLILDFIKLIQLEIKYNNYVFFVCTCGDDIGLSKNIFVKAVLAKGITCNSGFSVIMPNNYILMKGFDVDSPVLTDKKLREAIPRMEQINSWISNNRSGLFDCKQGHFPFFKTRIIWPLFNKYQISDKNFYATDLCNGCRLCEQKCPVGNIKVDKKPKWQHHCILCLACIHRCPQTAIQYGKKTQKKGRYYKGKK